MFSEIIDFHFSAVFHLFSLTDLKFEIFEVFRHKRNRDPFLRIDLISARTYILDR